MFRWSCQLMIAFAVMGGVTMSDDLSAAPPVHTQAHAPTFAVPPNLAELRVDYALTPPEERMLLQNGFLALDRDHFKSMGDAYPFQHHAVPLFVTTDALLDLWRSLHRELQKSTEQRVFLPELAALLPELIRSNSTLRAATVDPTGQTSLKAAALTLEVAQCLLTGRVTTEETDLGLRSRVEALVQRILAHREIANYPGEDFTLYRVRGYYAGDPQLERYFRTSLWLSRHFFSISPAPSPDPDSPLRAAIALAAAVRAAPPEARRRLQGLNALRQGLAGPPDAISIELLIEALDRSLGTHWSLLGALKAGSLQTLRTELSGDRYPRSRVWTRPVDLMEATFPDRTAALLPGIATPDSVLFHQSVAPQIPSRSLPSGLEVAAALGSSAARQEIRQKEGALADGVLNAVDRYGPALATDDNTTLFSGWLHVLSTLATVPEGSPAFMRRPAWQVEKLNTLLASWAQLRHNYLLYAEQNFTATLGKQLAYPALVEPNPPFYAALARLAQRARALLTPVGGLNAANEKLLNSFEARCREFEGYARAELNGTLTMKQAQAIDTFCDWLHTFPPSPAALVADVATGMLGETLYAATGDVTTLLVIPDPKSGQIYIGAVMAYYEFERPSSERLTDAQWAEQQAQLYLRPDRPGWASAFIAHEGGSDWALEAPLREAERLLGAHRSEAALDLLHSTVRAHPDTTLATQAQFRIGWYFYGRHDLDRAEQALQACLRLPGCEAFDRAQEILNQIHNERSFAERQNRVTAPRQKRQSDQHEALRRAIRSLKQAGANVERALAIRLLKDLPWDEIVTEQGMETADLMAMAAAACHTSACRDALGYAALTSGQWAASEALVRQQAVALFEQAASKPLRAAALGLAVQKGYLADRPQEALRLLKPFLKPNLFQANGGDAALRLILASPGHSEMAPSPRISLSARPETMFQDGLQCVRNALVISAYRAGHVKEAIDAALALPAKNGGAMEMDDFDFSRIAELWNELGEGELPAMSQLAIAEELERNNKEGEAAQQMIALTDRLPRSRLAPFALGYAVTLLQTAQREAIAKLVTEDEAPMQRAAAPIETISSPQDIARIKAIEDRLLRDYPESYPALGLRIRSEFSQGHLVQTRALLTRQSALKEGRDGPLVLNLPGIGDSSDIGFTLRQYDTYLEQLRPLLPAVPDPSLLSVQRIVSDGAELAEALAKTAANRKAEVFLTVARVYKSPVPAMRLLELFPDDPLAGDAWKLLLGNERMITPGAFALGGTEGVKWLAPFVDRGAGYARAESASALLLQQLSRRGYGGEQGIRSMQETVKEVEGLYPNSRTAAVAEIAMARTLLFGHRPEAMHAHADAALALLPKDDPLRAMILDLKSRAETEITAKHRQTWALLWAATLRVEGPEMRSEPPVPLVGGGLLLATEPDDQGRRQVTALDATTGVRRWTSRLKGTVLDMTLSPDGSRVYLALDTGGITALEVRSGAVRWERQVVAGEVEGKLDGVIATATAIVAYGAKMKLGGLSAEDDRVGVSGLSPQDGHLLWHRPDWHPARMGPEIKGKPVVCDGSIVIALSDPRVVAFSAETGKLLWERAYPKWQPPAGMPAFRRTRPTLLRQPALLDAHHVLVVSLLPSPAHYDLLDPRLGNLEQTIALDRMALRLDFTSGNGLMLEWGFNTSAALRRLPDLALLPVALPLLHMQSPAALDGPVLYVCNDQNTQVEAIDLGTGGVFARGNTPAATYGARTLLGEGKLFVIGFNGNVSAFPLLQRPVGNR